MPQIILLALTAALAVPPGDDLTWVTVFGSDPDASTAEVETIAEQCDYVTYGDGVPAGDALAVEFTCTVYPKPVSGLWSPTSDNVDPTCIDGGYAEVIGNIDADLSGARSRFSAADPAAFLLEALEARYPTGAYLTANGLQRSPFPSFDCLDLFTTPMERASPDGMLDAASVIVHECGHFYDIDLSGARSAVWVFTEDLTLTCNLGQGTSPARSLINSDAWASARPPCRFPFQQDCDLFAAIYLDGDPTDAVFDSGDQGFESVLEESVQYINSLATEWAFSDGRDPFTDVNSRDGVATFLWYLERYLAYMRVNTPGLYQQLLASPCWRETILTVWGRSWLYLEATEGRWGLEIDGEAILDLVRTPDLLDEIQRVRDAEGC